MPQPRCYPSDMKHLALTSGCLLVLAMGTGCSPNWGIGDDGGDGWGDDDGDDDGDEWGDDDGDDDSSPDGGSSDIPNEDAAICELPSHVPVSPRFGDPQLAPSLCSDQLQQRVRLVERVAGDWLVSLCSDGCNSCDSTQLHPLAIDGTSIDDALSSSDLGDCHLVEARGLIEAGDTCSYQALAVWEADELQRPPGVVAVRDAGELGPSATEGLAGWDLSLRWADSCECSSAEDCCDGGVDVYQFEVAPDEFATPGGVPVGVTIDGESYDFHARQAQSGPACSGPELVSWLLVERP